MNFHDLIPIALFSEPFSCLNCRKCQARTVESLEPMEKKRKSTALAVDLFDTSFDQGLLITYERSGDDRLGNVVNNSPDHLLVFRRVRHKPANAPKIEDLPAEG